MYYKQKGLCALSGVPLTHIRGNGQCPTNISIDRIDSSKGYEIDNIQLVSYMVNIMKNKFTKEELVWWCKQIIKHHKRKY